MLFRSGELLCLDVPDDGLRGAQHEGEGLLVDQQRLDGLQMQLHLWEGEQNIKQGVTVGLASQPSAPPRAWAGPVRGEQLGLEESGVEGARLTELRGAPPNTLTSQHRVSNRG